MKTKPLYLYVILIWFLLVIVFEAIVVESNIAAARRDFETKCLALYHMVNDQLAINETVLDGFAATVDAMGKIDRKKLRHYTSQILTRYPHIFMFEIAQKIPQRDERRFVRYMRRDVYRNFKIREFGYKTDRHWHPAGKKSFYLPITFMAPFPPSSRQVLGLDLNSNRFFLQSLKLSAQTHATVATRPFKLVEGMTAYLLHRPVRDRHDDPIPDGVNDRYVMLVILAKSLLGRTLKSMQGYAVSLKFADHRQGGVNSVLYQQAPVAPGNFASTWLPQLSFRQLLTSHAQPFILSIHKQLGWSALDWPILIILFIGAIGTFYIVIRYASIYHRQQIVRAEETNQLFYLANHDSLTGLANRNLLSDRLDHALKQAARNASRLAVLFIDLDNFKQVNDSYGHAAGDDLLIEVAARLRHCVRHGDTLARRSGDEFVVILENITDRDVVDQVVSKIHLSISKPFEIENHQLTISTSIGTAIFPDDADNAEALLDLADRRMYSRK